MIHPLGLASKGPIWYLVAATEKGRRTFRVDLIRSVAPTGERVVRPEGFDLAEAWRLIRRARGDPTPGARGGDGVTRGRALAPRRAVGAPEVRDELARLGTALRDLYGST